MLTKNEKAWLRRILLPGILFDFMNKVFYNVKVVAPSSIFLLGDDSEYV